MKITIITLGTRGDIQPTIALGKGFQAAGYDISIATHEIFCDFVKKHGLGFHPVKTDIREIMQSDAGVLWTESRNPFTLISRMREIFVPHAMSIASDCIAATEDADAVFYGLIGFMLVPSLMEKFRIPSMGIYLQPHYPTSEFAPALMPPLPQWLPLRQQADRLIYSGVDMMSDMVFRSIVDDVRQNIMSLPPMNTKFSQLARRAFPITHGFSPLVVQHPKDWREALHISGYWFLDEDYEPSNKFSEWLAAGSCLFILALAA